MNRTMNHLNVTLSASLVLLESTTMPSTLYFGSDTEGKPDEELLLMPEWAFTVTAIILFCIGLFGFLFNLIVIVLMVKDIQVRIQHCHQSFLLPLLDSSANLHQLWTPINIILLNLVCSDFCVSILGNPFTFTAAIHRRWIFGPALCTFYGYFMSLLGKSRAAKSLL